MTSFITDTFTLVNILREQGEQDEAILNFKEALSIARDLDEKEILRKTEIALGEVMLLKNDLPAALGYAETAQAIAVAQGSRPGQGDALLLKARIHTAQAENASRAVDTIDLEKKYEEIMSIYERSSQPYDLARAYHHYAQWLSYSGMTGKAADYAAKSRAICVKIGVRPFA